MEDFKNEHTATQELINELAIEYEHIEDHLQIVEKQQITLQLLR
jgi:hypothetical protein